MFFIKILSSLLGLFLLAIIGMTQSDLPSSYWITFVSERDGNADIYLMRADGRLQHPLTTDPTWDEFPTWSSDGKWIVFASEHNGTFEIYQIRPDGSQRQPLPTDSPDIPFPTWSRENQPITLSSNQTSISQNDWIMPDRGVFERLSLPRDFYGTPNFSPNGDWALISTEISGDNSDIFLIRADDSDSLQLTTHPAADRNPAWSPKTEPLPSMRTIFGSGITLLLVGLGLSLKSRYK